MAEDREKAIHGKEVDIVFFDLSDKDILVLPGIVLADKKKGYSIILLEDVPKKYDNDNIGKATAGTPMECFECGYQHLEEKWQKVWDEWLSWAEEGVHFYSVEDDYGLMSYTPNMHEVCPFR
jgi:hypothetical protein